MIYTFHIFLSETGQIDPILIERYNTPGFVGCLSRVQFNSVAPLKAALHLGQAAPVSTEGILVPSNCGASPWTISPMASASDPWHLETGKDTHSQMIRCDYNLPNILNIFFFQSVGAVFPFNEDKDGDDEVDRNSAIIGGKYYPLQARDRTEAGGHLLHH